MADNKQGFWSYLGDQVKEWFGAVKDTVNWLVKGTTNAIGWKDWWEWNTTLWSIITWTQQSKPTPAATPVSTPDLNTVAQNDVNRWGVDVTSKVNLTSNNGWASTSSPISTPDLVWNVNAVAQWTSIDNLQVEDLAKNYQREEDAEDDNIFETSWKWLKWKYNSIRDSQLEKSLESVRQSREKHFALSYDPNSKNITELVINEPQWWFDDFSNKFFGRWSWNWAVFNELLEKYNKASEEIWNSSANEAEKLMAQSKLFDYFYNEVNDRELLRAFQNDRYSDWNIVHAAVWQDTKVFWRLKDKYTQEELNELAKNKVDEWVYKPTKEQFSAFLKMYQDNDDDRRNLSLEAYYWEAWLPDRANINYRLTEESMTWLRSAQAQQVLERVRTDLLEAEDAWKITSTKRNEIETRFISAINDNLSDVYYWMESPLAYYTAVKNKDSWDLTSWERTILGIGPELEKLLTNYTNALERWADETIKYWIQDWELSHPVDMIDWKSINEFLVDAVRENVANVWWWELYATESVEDALQLINNQIWYLYWQGKWNRLRKWWQEWQRYLWAFWYTAWELASLWIMWWTKWIEWLFGTDTNVADYMLWDVTELMNVTTDEWDWWRLMKKYWLSALENVPEFGWELWASTLPLRWMPAGWTLWNITKGVKATKNVSKLQKLWEVKSEISTIEKINNWIRKWLWISAQQGWSRNWLSRMVDSTLKATEWKNITFNNLVKMWSNIWKWIVQDQLIDWIASYYDSEAYSTASFLLSTWLTWITEILAPITKYSQIWKRLSNYRRGLEWNQGTAWRVMSYLTEDPDTMKRLEGIFWKGNVSFDVLKWIGANWDQYEDVMRVAYNLLNDEWKAALWKFSKDLAFEKLKQLKTVDWESTYGQNLMRIINARWTNVADVFKYLFGLPWQVEVWWFISKILLKNWAEGIQTRLLKSEYDIWLDILDGGFRKRLSEWFTADDIAQLENRTQYKGLIEWWTPSEKYFVEDDWKYFLTSEWAEKFKLNVSDYTEAMRKADLMRETAEETKQFLDEKTKQLMANKWLTKEVIDRLATSWWFQKTVDILSNVVCKI